MIALYLGCLFLFQDQSLITLIISKEFLVDPLHKQIIGFAKFCTCQEALEAKKLKGHQIDAEKDAVLRVVMAKKNLHTKCCVPHWQ